LCARRTRRRQARSWSQLGASLRAHLRERPVLARQVKALPDIDQRLGERFDQAVVVIGRRRDAQALHAARHGRIIDRLDVDAVLVEQKVAHRLAPLRIADEDRHDVRLARHDRQPGSDERGLGRTGVPMLRVPLGR